MARLFLCALALTIATAASARADDHPRLEMIAAGNVRAELPLVGSDMQVAVRGAIAQVRHTQHFANPATTAIEAVYIFPLPERAAVGAMTMRIGARTIAAKIARREDARATYERARAVGQTAALLEQERPNVFTQSVSGILPGEVIDIELTYDVLLEPHDGWTELALPTVVGPRYIPGAPSGTRTGVGVAADTERVPDAARISPPLQAMGAPATVFAFGLDLQPGLPVAEVDSPTHELIATELDHDHLAIALSAPAAAADKDLVVRWRVEVAEPTIGVLAGFAGAEGYLSAIIQPPELPPIAAAPRELVFVLDTSGSMAGPPLALVQRAIRYALDHVQPGDRIRILNFSIDVGGLDGGALLAATPANLRRARGFVDGLASAGGTEMLAGIRAALADPPSDGRVRYVCFMTDGFIGNDDEILAEIARTRAANVHLFSFGVGSSVNRSLLDEMARDGHGASQILLLDDPPEPQIARFFRQLVAPMWSDVRVEFPGLGVTDVTPAIVGDLFAGQPIVVTARYAAGARGRVRVIGRIGDQVATLEQAIALPGAGGDGALLGRLWARHRIRELAAAGRTGDAEAARGAITTIALAHALASPYTSFVAVDDRPRVEGQPVPTLAVPVITQSITDEYTRNIPTGRTFGTVLGSAAGSQGDGYGGETIEISDRAPMIDTSSTSTGYTIDGSTGPHDVAQNSAGVGDARGELSVAAGLDRGGGGLAEIRGQVGLTLTPRYQLGFGAGLTLRPSSPSTFGFLATLTRWGLWRQLALRLGLGLGATLDDDVTPAPAWRAELLHPLPRLGRARPLLSLGLGEQLDDDHGAAATLGVSLAF